MLFILAGDLPGSPELTVLDSFQLVNKAVVNDGVSFSTVQHSVHLGMV